MIISLSASYGLTANENAEHSSKIANSGHSCALRRSIGAHPFGVGAGLVPTLRGMRMSDQPSVAVETLIKADSSRIYELVSDLEVMASFGTEFVGGEWSSGRPGEVGSTFLGQQRMGDLHWETTSTVTVAEPGKQFVWVVGDPENMTAEWDFTLRSVPKGTEVTYSFVHGPGPSGLRTRIDANPERESATIESRLAMLQENMVKTLEGIRRRTAA